MSKQVSYCAERIRTSSSSDDAASWGVTDGRVGLGHHATGGRVSNGRVGFGDSASSGGVADGRVRFGDGAAGRRVSNWRVGGVNRLGGELDGAHGKRRWRE